jgi:glutaminase
MSSSAVRAKVRGAVIGLLGTVAVACASAGGGGTLVAVSGAPPLFDGVAASSGAEPERLEGGRQGADRYREAVAQVYKELKGTEGGKNADYIPALAKVDPGLYGIALVTVQGTVYEIGDSHNEFSIQSVSKPFTLARTLEAVGLEAVQERIGVNATGQKFNSILAIELNQANKRPPPGNPFVNAGAIATVDLLPATTAGQKWEVIMGVYGAFAARTLTVNQEIYKSESETNTHNRAIVALLKDYEVIKGDPSEALDLYTRQCSVSVSAKDLAVMGATLANGGRNPVSHQQVVSADTASRVLAVMATAGLYETSGDWLAATGLPAKSGVGGGIVAVMPGRFAVGVFSPPLDEAGNSVRGQKAIEGIIKRLGGGLFTARTAGKRGPEGPTAQGGN